MSRDEWKRALALADTRMKQTKGHAYLTVLKTRCQRCGRSPNQKENCPRWFEQFCDMLFEVVRDGEYSPPPAASLERER